MRERRGCFSSKQPRNAHLTAGRREQVAATYHEVDALLEVVDRRDELIRPVALAIANHYVAALRRRILRLRSEQQIVECLDARIDSQPPGHVTAERDASRSTGAGVAMFDRTGRHDLTTAARAAVEQTARREFSCGGRIDLAALALSRLAASRSKRAGGEYIRREAQPVEVVQDRGLVLQPAALAIVVLDPQQHLGAVFASQRPHVMRVDHVAEV